MHIVFFNVLKSIFFSIFFSNFFLFFGFGEKKREPKKNTFVFQKVQKVLYENSGNFSFDFFEFLFWFSLFFSRKSKNKKENTKEKYFFKYIFFPF
jgi:hypothetical protein